jgi:hypothetical protein
MPAIKLATLNDSGSFTPIRVSTKRHWDWPADHVFLLAATVGCAVGGSALTLFHALSLPLVQPATQVAVCIGAGTLFVSLVVVRADHRLDRKLHGWAAATQSVADWLNRLHGTVAKIESDNGRRHADLMRISQTIKSEVARGEVNLRDLIAREGREVHEYLTQQTRYVAHLVDAIRQHRDIRQDEVQAHAAERAAVLKAVAGLAETLQRMEKAHNSRAAAMERRLTAMERREQRRRNSRSRPAGTAAEEAKKALGRMNIRLIRSDRS